MGQIPDKTVDVGVLDTIVQSTSVERFEPAAEEAVVVGFDEFFVPEFVSVEDVL